MAEPFELWAKIVVSRSTSPSRASSFSRSSSAPAAFDVVSRSRYDRQIYGKLIESYEPVDLEPAAALKLIEGAVEYAKQCGLSPHRDYRIGKPIFGDIDSASCGEEFIYGDKGKPFFIAGPNDRPSRCRQIIDLLTAHCGPDGFTFLMPTSGSPRLLT